MSADKKYACRRLEKAQWATVMSVDEPPQDTASPQPAMAAKLDHEVTVTAPFTAENKLRILKLSGAYTRWVT